jgi:hypothetical protein
LLRAESRRVLFDSALAAYKAETILEIVVNRLTLLASILLPAAVAAGSATAAERWTFCIASALGAKDVWITDVFAAGIDRERLEDDLKALLERRGAARIVAQCPQPNDDKTSVVNAQTGAEDFNRKLGASLHAISAQEFQRR